MLRLDDLLFTLTSWIVGTALWLAGVALIITRSAGGTARFVVRATVRRRTSTQAGAPVPA